MRTRAIEGGLLALQGLQVAFLLLHDWVPLGRLSNLAAVRSTDSTARLFWTTILSALPFAAVFVVCCLHGTTFIWPMWLQTWLWYTCLFAIAGALIAWWIPYLLRPNPERAARYKVRFAGTVSFLPERNGIRPDALHVVYHVVLVATVVLLYLL